MPGQWRNRRLAAPLVFPSPNPRLVPFRLSSSIRAAAATTILSSVELHLVDDLIRGRVSEASQPACRRRTILSSPPLLLHTRRHGKYEQQGMQALPPSTCPCDPCPQSPAVLRMPLVCRLCSRIMCIQVPACTGKAFSLLLSLATPTPLCDCTNIHGPAEALGPSR